MERGGARAAETLAPLIHYEPGGTDHATADRALLNNEVVRYTGES